VLRDDDALWDLVESGLFGDPALHIVDEDVAEVTNLEDGTAHRVIWKRRKSRKKTTWRKRNA
jgi:hypothetical protein